MVSIVENWALLVGTVIGVLPAEPGEKFATLTIQIEAIETVGEFPMLLQQGQGDRLRVRVQPQQIAAAEGLIGSTQSIRVRRGRDPDIAFAAHDWKPGGS